ncbi:MAG TPA: ABC transporter permease [Verrucomicrobiae bacterium]|nr:ABC transporter permease [Verrucomicrobiae bacterium]
MKNLRGWLGRLGGLFGKQRKDRELNDEIESHLQLHIEDNLRLGMTPEEARRQAMMRLGGVDATREACRDQRGVPWLETLWQDVRYGARQLRRSPGFTTVAVLTLALGIGATTAIYSVVSVVLLNPIPGPEPDRLVELAERHYGNRNELRVGGISTKALEMLRTKAEFFSTVVSMERLDLGRKTGDFIEEVSGRMVSPNFFNQWGIPPVLGRTFSADEAARVVDYDTQDRDTVMVLSHSLWQGRFGGRPDVIGQTMEANGRHFTVIGVMPPTFRFPEGNYPTFWTPVGTTNPREKLGNIHAFARLKPGVSLLQTQAMLDGAAAQLKIDFPEIYDNEWRRRGDGYGLLARPLRLMLTQTPYGAEGLQRTLLGLLAAIGFVLLIACMNVANLMLARTEKRQQELAIRAAVGAGRARLTRQLFTESLLLGGAGAVIGLVVAWAGTRALVSLIPENFPRLRAVQIDGQALGFSLLLSVGTALAFGLVPAWQAGRASVGNALKRAGTGTTGGTGWRRYRGALVAAEVALSLVLLAGAGLMIDSVIRLLQVNPGFDADNLVLAHPGLLRGEKYGFSDRSKEVHVALFENLREQFAALPGVKAVAIGKLSGSFTGYTLDGQTSPIVLQSAGTGVGEGDLFRVMGVPLLTGRYFEEGDIRDGAGTVIINESMAQMCWHGANPLGKTFHYKGGQTFQVIGVVADAKIGLRLNWVDTIEPTFFRPYQESVQSGGFGPYFVVRTRANPRALIPALRETIKTSENSMTPPWFQVARQTLYAATAAERLYMSYLVLFAAAGLLLSALGIYGVLAYSVARRTREIGIRMALGAEQRQVLRLVMGEGARLAGVGLIIGILAAYWLTRLLESQLFGVKPSDPLVFGSAVLFLLAVTLFASWLPARRAAKVDPAIALRHD